MNSPRRYGEMAPNRFLMRGLEAALLAGTSVVADPLEVHAQVRCDTCRWIATSRYIYEWSSTRRTCQTVTVLRPNGTIVLMSQDGRLDRTFRYTNLTSRCTTDPDVLRRWQVVFYHLSHGMWTRSGVGGEAIYRMRSSLPTHVTMTHDELPTLVWFRSMRSCAAFGANVLNQQTAGPQ